MTAPPTVLTVVVRDLASDPDLTGLCAGFENASWRAHALADELMNSLPGFCLTYSEVASMTGSNAVPMLRRAARLVYSTEKYSRRGEFGELLLHVVLQQVHGTLPAISKLYYKDAANDTVKGFDCVHVVPTTSGLELWLGEVKFYADASAAVRDVVTELQKHTDASYLRGEFLAIRNKIDDAWPHADSLARLIHENVSLDSIFEATCIPVLLTYDSAVTGAHTSMSTEYRAALAEEMAALRDRLAEHSLPRPVRIHLFLVPLATKEVLIATLHEKMRAWQAI